MDALDHIDSRVDDAVAGNENLNASCAFRGKEVRLIQQEPNWALHALLRMKGVSYTVENCKLPHSLGVELPCIVDGSYVVNGADALLYVNERNDRQQQSVESNTPIESESESESQQLLCAWIYRDLDSPLNSLRRTEGHRTSTNTELQDMLKRGMGNTTNNSNKDEDKDKDKDEELSTSIAVQEGTEMALSWIALGGLFSPYAWYNNLQVGLGLGLRVYFSILVVH